MLICEGCGKPLSKTQKRYCSVLCRNRATCFKVGNIGPWLGRKMPFSDETKKMLRDRIVDYTEHESPEQRRIRIEHSSFTRNKNKSIWVPKIRSGENHEWWKGDAIDYHMMHRWIRKHWKKNGICEICGKVGRTQWSNKDHLYKRSVRSDWQELCVSCHRVWDKTHNLVKK